jgi:hypothetical protein
VTTISSPDILNGRVCSVPSWFGTPKVNVWFPTQHKRNGAHRPYPYSSSKDRAAGGNGRASGQMAGKLLGTPGAKRREAVSERVHRPAECSAGLTAPGFLPRRRALGGACWPIAPFRLAGDSASTQLPLYVSQPHPSRFSFHPDRNWVPSKPEMPFRLSTCLRGGHFDACRQERRPAEGGTLGPTGAWPQGEASALRR